MKRLAAENQHCCLLTAQQIEQQPEQSFRHPLNSEALRQTKSLGDAVGLERLGLHQVRVEPGMASTQFHYHHYEEEFLYILSGRGIAEIGDAQYEVGPGDFMGFTAPSLPHSLHNPFAEDLVYLMGGERREYDVCDYPRIKKRQFRSHNQRQLVDLTEEV
ncbi:MAG: cupin domain-containing protein [Cyanobacteria bacterium P01_A01_bin.17]